MNKANSLFVLVWMLLSVTNSLSQQAQFNIVMDEKINRFGTVFAITQDQQGYIWFSSETKGLIRYNGKEFTAFKHDPENPNSLASNDIVSLSVDSSGIIWIATYGKGLDRFDHTTNTFTHFRHNPSDTSSISSDSVTSLMIDREGTVWAGTYFGLDRFETGTARFTHFTPGFFSNRTGKTSPIFIIYEDKSGIIWLGAGSPFVRIKSDKGGLFRFNRSKEEFNWYGSDSADPTTLSNTNVTSIYEDSKSNLWVGTKGDGLHIFNRSTGKFTRYPYDPAHPEKLSGPPVDITNPNSFISFITEDEKGKIWIASILNGVNCYDPVTQKTTHFGTVENDKRKPFFAKDTLTGFKEVGSMRKLHTKDGSLWITGFYNNIYAITYGKTTIPFFPSKRPVNSFYLEPNGNILWFGTDDGLVRKDLNTQQTKIWLRDPNNKNSLDNNSIAAVRSDEKGKIWVATHEGGLDQFDPLTGIFTHYKHDNTDPHSIGMDSLHCIFFEDEKYMWVGAELGLTRMDRSTGHFTTFRHNENDSGSVTNGAVFSFAKDKNGYIWIASSGGLNRYDHKTGKFTHYLKEYAVKTVFIDFKGVLWIGASQGLLYHDSDKNQFKHFTNSSLPEGIENVLNVIEDNEQNLWITTAISIFKLNSTRDELKLYNLDYGILSSSASWLDNLRAPDGRLFFSGSEGYYMIDPKELNDSRTLPVLNFTGLKIGDKEIYPGANSILKAALWKTDKIVLDHSQNTFTFEFTAIDFKTSGDLKYLYQLENFDKEWRSLGKQHSASFFNIPPGTYKLHIKAINGVGTMVQKSITVVITPPWWLTWWAYIIYGLLFLLAGWGIYKYQRRAILKAERERTRERELLQAREIEKAYTDLKLTQQQLIQSEKMASLGELTAGIAHEIQNPLNFINNFSEVNKELLAEMNEEIEKGNFEEVKSIAKDVTENEEKINHHGKRADGIVKGMLQHSRSSTGQKESADINKLADEYFRLAYHGLRAKDKSFNATLKTSFDESIGNINIIPQDIGRVLLNLYNNAFYVVTEKKKQQANGYEPTVSVSTKKIGNKIEMKVSDNGNGIPEKVVDKIFQPFFTTKPTGEGTGLGLSLSYDIIKAHGGELKVESAEGKGADFIIVLPINILP